MTTNNNDSLDDWRSSHIIGDITSESAGQDVILMGWVESIRKQGGIIFLILKDRSSSIQIVLKKGTDKNWIQKATASIKKRGTKGKCTPITKKGCTGRAKALAKTFKKIAAKNKKA